MSGELRVAVCGAGFIGLPLVEHLLAAGAAVSVLDHKAAPHVLAGRVRWTTGDFADEAVLRKVLHDTDVAYHLVSSTVPGDEHVGMFTELAENIASTMRFLDTCLAAGVRRVVFVSSSSVYGMQRTMPVRESAQTDPISSHGIQKLTIEKYLLLHQFNTGIEVRIARLSNPYGPGQNLRGRQGFVAIALGKLIDGGSMLLRDGGSPVRDFVFIDDVCEALVRFGSQADAPSVVNIGTGEGHTLREVIETIGSIAGRSIATTDGPLRKADIPVSILDVSLAREALGFAPATRLADGLRRTMDHHGLVSPGADADG